MSSSYDTVGPMAKSAYDVAVLLQIMAFGKSSKL